jgi:hypothetical protein
VIVSFFGRRERPCGDCADGWCTMNCGPRVPITKREGGAMIGNHVRVIRENETPVQGVLHKCDAAGVIVYMTEGLPEMQGNLFIPMARIIEIVDLGRAP